MIFCLFLPLPTKIVLLVAYKEKLQMGVDGRIAPYWLRLVLGILFLIVCARRLHDMNHSSQWSFIGLIPMLESLVLIVWCGSTRSHKGANQWGENPLNKRNQG